ncbi:DUF4286 family protein [Odoribacter laneus]|uniref:DUF4286 family protein n=1 Tax=Odoribacter laneus TaxID=626933 RepID=UPI0003366BE1|nr:DUF4286 family protein [Odoribacter laneus]CCZ82132.1 putative uncharacterized protein [Odoribacter laneus CAG:561]
MRIIFNTTFIVNESIETEWISFIRKYYLAYLRQNGLTQDILFTKVSIDQPEGKTYSLQLVFDSSEALDCFLKIHLPLMEEKISEKYKNYYLCFSSILTEIGESQY